MHVLGFPEWPGCSTALQRSREIFAGKVGDRARCACMCSAFLNGRAAARPFRDRARFSREKSEIVRDAHACAFPEWPEVPFSRMVVTPKASEVPFSWMAGRIML